MSLTPYDRVEIKVAIIRRMLDEIVGVALDLEIDYDSFGHMENVLDGDAQYVLAEMKKRL